jgi:hypothetical protein
MNCIALSHPSFVLLSSSGRGELCEPRSRHWAKTEIQAAFPTLKFSTGQIIYKSVIFHDLCHHNVRWPEGSMQIWPTKPWFHGVDTSRDKLDSNKTLFGSGKSNPKEKGLRFLEPSFLCQHLSSPNKGLSSSSSTSFAKPCNSKPLSL